MRIVESLLQFTAGKHEVTKNTKTTATRRRGAVSDI
jgi:hypothetical protein